MLVENNTFIVTGGWVPFICCHGRIQVFNELDSHMYSASGLGEQVIRTLVAQRGRAIVNISRAKIDAYLLVLLLYFFFSRSSISMQIAPKISWKNLEQTMSTFQAQWMWRTRQVYDSGVFHRKQSSLSFVSVLRLNDAQEQVQEVFKDIKSVYPDWPIVGAILCSGVVFPPENLKGYGPNGQLTSFEQFKHIVNVNLLGTYCVAQKVAEILLDNKPLDNDDGKRKKNMQKFLDLVIHQILYLKANVEWSLQRHQFSV